MTLSAAEIAKDKAECVDKILAARIKLLMSQPFWGTLATRLRLVDSTEEKINGQIAVHTAATDGRHFYYNRNFLKKLGPDEMIFLMAHEVEHCVYQHMQRCGSRDRARHNAAADFMINLELDENKIGKLPDPKVIPCCYDTKYKDMTSDEIYELLAKDPQFGKSKITLTSKGKGKGKGSGKGEDGEGDEEDGEGSGPGYDEFDQHISPEDCGLSEEEQELLQSEIRGAMIEAAKAAGAGRTPAGVRRLLKDLYEPQMNWKELLDMHLRSMIKDDYTWQRCSRKTQAMGIYLPSLADGERVEAFVALDNSGSMSIEMIREQLGEVKGIMETFADFKLHVCTFDTAVYNHQIFTPDNLNDIDDYEVMGGGGTSFQCVWDFMIENDIVPLKLIFFTDGYDSTPQWGTADYCDTLFVVHGDPNHKLVAPHGQTTWFD